MEKSPEMTKTLAAKALHSEGELWSTSQQFLSLEIYLAFLFFLSTLIKHMPESNNLVPSVSSNKEDNKAWKCRPGCLLYF